MWCYEYIEFEAVAGSLSERTIVPKTLPGHQNITKNSGPQVLIQRDSCIEMMHIFSFAHIAKYLRSEVINGRKLNELHL